MDKQLACATFATLIPVLLIAGYFSTGNLTEALSTRAGRTVLLVITTACTVGEIAAIIGTGTRHPSDLLVALGMWCSMLAAWGLFLGVIDRIRVAAKHQQHRQWHGREQQSREGI